MNAFFMLLFMVFLSWNSFADQEIGPIDNQSEIKGAAERAFAAHHSSKNKTLYSRPSRVEQQNLSLVQKIEGKAHTISNSFGDFKVSSYNFVGSIKRLFNNVWGILTGDKNLPPYANGLFYVYLTGGKYPEVSWFVDGVGDTDGTIVQYEFDFGDGTVQLIPAAHIDSSKAISHVYLATGTYNTSVKVFDNDGAFSTFYSSINVTHSNQLPVPKFTLQNNQVPDFLKVDFSSQATDDSGIIRYTWRFGDGSADAISANLTSTSRTYSSPGLYNVSFVVRDSHRGQVTASTQAYVGQHQPSGGMYPIPLVYSDGMSGVAPLTVQFDGLKSFDIGGSVSSYEWNFGDYTSPQNASYKSQPKFTYSQPGSYYGSLKVTDNGGRTNTRYFTVYVMSSSGGTASPEVLAYPTGLRTYWFDSDYFSLHAPVPTYYQVWNFGDGTPLFRGAYPTHTYATDGVYTVTLHLYDVRGGVHQIQKNITVTSDQSAPTAYFLSSHNNNSVNTSVDFFTSNTSLVNPSTIASWDFGDGTRLSGLHKDLLNVSHIYTNKGFYPVTLVVTDAFGKTASHSRFVNIQSEQWPIHARIDLSNVIGKIPLPMRFDAKGSSSSEGTITKYNWAVYSPTGSQYNQNAVWTSVYPVGGEHYVDLFIEDQAGNTGYSNVVFSALDPAQVPPTNNAPIANIQMNYYFDDYVSNLYVSGHSSYDTDGDRIVSYDWIFDSSPASSEPGFNKTFSDSDTHQLALRVTDRWGAIGEQKLTFNYPRINFDHSPQKGVPGEAVYFVFDEATFNIGNAQVTQVEWLFGDGSPAVHGQVVNHIYQNAGNYQVTMVVQDNLQRTYTRVKTIAVEAAPAFQALITAQNMTGTIFGRSQGFIFNGNLPIEVFFDLNKSHTDGEVVSATWDFGDGSSGFGLTPSHVYTTPGIYPVTVTATDHRNNLSIGTLSVSIGSTNTCSLTDGVEDCVLRVGTHGNILPMDISDWIFTHDKNQSLTWGLQADSQVFLKAEEEGGANINLSSAVVFNGAQLILNKAALQALNIDFSKTYELSVSATLSDDSSFRGAYPNLRFGIGILSLVAEEQDVRLSIEGPAGYQKYFSLGSNLSLTIGNLPAGAYTIFAEKNSVVRTYLVNIVDSTPVPVEIDLSASAVLQDEMKWKQEVVKRKEQLSSMGSMKKMQDTGSLVDFPIAPCGQYMPFPAGVEGEKNDVALSAVTFDSFSPDSIVDLPLTRAFGEEVNIRCSVAAGVNNYSAYKWDLADSPKWSGVCPLNPLWYDVDAAAKEQLQAPIQINWKVRDTVSGKQSTGRYSTSIQKILTGNNISLEQISEKFGVSNRPNIYMWGPSFKLKIPVKNNYQRPQLTLSLKSQHNFGIPDYRMYKVSCEILKRHDVENLRVSTNLRAPEITRIVELSDGGIHSPSYNGRQLMRSKYFPVDVDTNITSGSYFNMPDAYKVKLGLHVNSGSSQPQSITKVKVALKHENLVLAEHIYDIDPNGFSNIDIESGDFEANLMLDAAHFSGVVPLKYVNHDVIFHQPIILEFTPLSIEGIAPNLLRTKQLVGVTPLFNLKDSRHQLQICRDGFYNENLVSAYTQSFFLKRINMVWGASGFGRFIEGKVRCNDASLPWGGDFKLPGAPIPVHRGHRDGRAMDIRYFNLLNGSDKDDYDRSEAFDRRKDLSTYLRLSVWADRTANNSAFVLDKRQIYQMCTPLLGTHWYATPCTHSTTEESLTADDLIDFCQLNDRQDIMDFCNGYVSGYKEAIYRFAVWVNTNSESLLQLRSVFSKYLISDGLRIPPIPPVAGFESSKWQYLALNEGKLPDGRDIYRLVSAGLTGYILVPMKRVCWAGPGKCELNINDNFRDDLIHSNHIHVE